jgi:predicted PurR-regulated permease PerM
MEQQRVSPIFMFIVGAGAAVLVLAGMKAAAGLVVSILLAGMLTIALTPLQNWLVKKKFPGWLALITTIIVGILILVAIILILVAGLAQFVEALPQYSDEVDELTVSLTTFLDGYLSEYEIDVEATLADLDITASRIVEIAVNLTAGLLNALTDTGLVIVIIAFMLFEALEFPRKLAVVRPWVDEGIIKRFDRSLAHTRQYLVLTAAVGAGAAALDVVLLMIIGVPFALLWGILSFLLSFIPNVGFILALIPPTILALLELGWPAALAVIVGYVLINGLFDNVLKPKYMGEGLDLSAMLVFLSLIFWGFILGPLGAILAIPLTVLVKELVIESDPKWSWIGVLMGTAAGAEKEAEALEAIAEEE